MIFLGCTIVTNSGYSSTPSRSEDRSIPPPALHRVEAELDALATSQQQGSRDIQELRENIRSIKEDLSTLLASTRASSSSRMKIPPELSVHSFHAHLYGIILMVTLILLQAKVKALHMNLENQFHPSLP